MTLQHFYRARLIRCVDGDTAVFRIDTGFYNSHECSCRFEGFDTPERGQPGFRECTQRLEDELDARADSDGWLVLKTSKAGKYGRWLVRVGSEMDILFGDSLMRAMEEEIAKYKEMEGDSDV